MNVKKKRPIWYIMTPLLINLIISFSVQYIAQMVYMLVNYPRMQEVMDDTDALMSYAYEISVELLQYTTEITMVATLVMLPISIYLFKKDRKEWGTTQGDTDGSKIRITHYVTIAVMCITTCVAANCLIILSNVSSISPTYNLISENLYVPSLWVQVICLGIIIPIGEEILMRGLVYKRMTHLISKRRAMVISALIFGLMHGNLVQFLYATGIGILLAYLYERFDTIKAPIFAHMILNLTSVLATKLNLFTWIYYSPARFAMVTIVCATLAAAMYVAMRPQTISEVEGE